MAIQLNDDRSSLSPVVKRTALGQTFVGAIVKFQTRDRLKKSDSGEMVPMKRADGKVRQEMVVTLVTMPGTDAPAGLGDWEGTPDPGDLVRVILKGQSFADWITAKKLLGRVIYVGDVLTMVADSAQVYDQNGRATGPVITDQKVLSAVPRGKTVGIYASLRIDPGNDADWIAAAEAAYKSATAKPLPDATDDDDQVPF